MLVGGKFVSFSWQHILHYDAMTDAQSVYYFCMLCFMLSMAFLTLFISATRLWCLMCNTVLMSNCNESGSVCLTCSSVRVDYHLENMEKTLDIGWGKSWIWYNVRETCSLWKIVLTVELQDFDQSGLLNLTVVVFRIFDAIWWPVACF